MTLTMPQTDSLMLNNFENDGMENDLGVGNRASPASGSLSSADGDAGKAGCENEGGNSGVGTIGIQVQMLDDSITLFHIQSKAQGKVLFEQVCKQLNLLEIDFFGLEYQDANNGATYWLDLDKQLNHQIGLPSACFSASTNLNSASQPLMRFCVKFYTPDPALIEEEYARYLFSLQIKRDMATGQLQCNDNTAALLASYIVQAECGDHMTEDYPDHAYLSTFKFVPHQDGQMERRIMESHKKHAGQTPAEADLNLLETARRCELYGTKMHPSKDHEGVPLNLAVAHMGVQVFQNFTKITTFSWAKIRKLSFKRKKFQIKLHPEGYGYYKDTVEFYFDDRNHCKNFWKKCVEHHSFFRCSTSMAEQRQKEKHRLLSRGSSFRYSGRTQKQMEEFMRENSVRRRPFQRCARRNHGVAENVGQSVAVQPLLPVDDNLPGRDFTPSRTNHNQGAGVTLYAEPVEPSSTAASPSKASAWPHPSYCTSIFANTLIGNNQLGDGQPTHDLSNGRNVIRTTRGQNANVPDGSTFVPTKMIPVCNAIGSVFHPASPMRLAKEDSADGALSPVSSKSAGTDTDTDVRKKRYPTDRAYFIAKEILMTERTYKKDLEIMNLWFRDEVTKEEGMPEELLTTIFSNIDPLYELHCTLLKDIEQRMATWEGRGNAHLDGDYKKISDVLVRKFDSVATGCYFKYVETHSAILERLQTAMANNAKFAQVVRDFESQKVCYLPLTTLIVKPLHRILHYDMLLERLLKHYTPSHPDYQSTSVAQVKMQSIVRRMSIMLGRTENSVKLAELQRDLGGYELLPSDEREFLREGCLQKLSRRGFQQRMFFLFSDILIYANRTTQPTPHFKVHGHLALPDLTVLDSEPRLGAEFCFNLFDGKKATLLSASSYREKILWMDDIAEAGQMARERTGAGMGFVSPSKNFSTLKSMSGSDDGLVLDRGNSVPPGDQHPHQGANSSVHVCWHRTTTIDAPAHHRSMRSTLSGYLLRKFKSNSGWQKLWVVFTGACLYFFKTFQDDFPLANLPLLGYEVHRPDPEADQLSKDYIFKLVFKNHIYFFRAESQYTFERWIEVLGSATTLSNELAQIALSAYPGEDLLSSY